MKNPTLIVASLCLAVGLCVVSASAQSLEAKVPFSFFVSGKTLPADDYTMTIRANLLQIADGTGRIVALASVYDVAGQPGGDNGQVFFHCYGERCFLAELRSAHQLTGRGLIKSHAEVALAKEQTGKYFAVVGREPSKRP